MKNIFEIIKSNPLFQGIPFSNFESMLSCLSGRTAAYKKNDVILLSGDTVNFVGLVLTGGVKIITSCTAACPFHANLIENMLKLLAHKNLMLNQKIEVLSKRTTKEKLMCFFDYQRGAAKKFTIPFSREEMAHYLCVDRSAMSNELCKMRDEGLIRFNRNEFEII